MINNCIFSCLLGIFLKIYDDFKDLHIKKCSFILEISKIIIIICSFLLIQNHYDLNVIIFISLLLSHFCKVFDDIFWYAYTLFIGFFCLLNCQKITSCKEYLSFKIFFFLYIPIHIYFEETCIHEEFSIYKMNIRTYSVIINSIFLLFLELFDYIHTYNLYFFVYLILFVNSYFVTNIIIQLVYLQYIKPAKTEKKQKNRKNKETPRKKKQKKHKPNLNIP